MKQNVVIACRNAAGEPELVSTIVECTESEYDLGMHYDFAIENAEEAGYEHPMVCFDEAEHNKLKTIFNLDHKD